MKINWNITNKLKALSKYILLGLILLTVVAISINISMVQNSKSKCFNDVLSIPPMDVVLVLGTSRSPDGRVINSYFYERVKTASELFFSGKVKHFILSGDNSIRAYNEPQDMKNLLMEFGVPEKKISLDFAGFRTLDSVVRAKKIFGQDSITIVSQDFHIPRALFLARQFGIEAVGMIAPVKVGETKHRKVLFREFFARCKAFLDVYILNKKPKYLGEKIEINLG